LVVRVSIGCTINLESRFLHFEIILLKKSLRAAFATKPNERKKYSYLSWKEMTVILSLKMKL